MRRNTIVGIVCFVAVVLISGGMYLWPGYCKKESKTTATPAKAEVSKKQRERQWERQRRQNDANSLIEGLLYVKDPRTGICFAYYFKGDDRSHMLAAVSESAVPPEMLIVANPDQKK